MISVRSLYLMKGNIVTVHKEPDGSYTMDQRCAEMYEMESKLNKEDVELINATTKMFTTEYCEE